MTVHLPPPKYFLFLWAMLSLFSITSCKTENTEDKRSDEKSCGVRVKSC